jgi:hypothetical protein
MVAVLTPFMVAVLTPFMVAVLTPFMVAVLTPFMVAVLTTVEEWAFQAHVKDAIRNGLQPRCLEAHRSRNCPVSRQKQSASDTK